jgi:hypothetical protein
MWALITPARRQGDRQDGLIALPSLTIDRFDLALHIHSNTRAETHKRYDNVVAATSYIGPTVKP